MFYKLPLLFWFQACSQQLGLQTRLARCFLTNIKSGFIDSESRIETQFRRNARKYRNQATQAGLQSFQRAATTVNS